MMGNNIIKYPMRKDLNTEALEEGRSEPMR